MSDPVVVAEGLGKTFRIPRSEHRSLRGRLLNPFSNGGVEEFRAIEAVDFAVERGEFFGLIGRNGSGKSTLLKVLAGIYESDRGSMQINGSIAPFIELGVGFNEDLSAHDNVYINGAILGMSRKQIAGRYDEIVEFAELQDFMQMKLRNFSSGMLMRLAFAIAVQSGAEILLVDEVLAVGDERFQRKCFEVFRERKRRGETVVFVSHDMNAVEAFCDRVVLLEKGVQVALGTPASVVPKYHELNRPIEGEGHVADIVDPEQLSEISEFTFTGADVALTEGRLTEWTPSSPLVAGLAVQVRESAIEAVTIRVLVTNTSGGLLGTMDTHVDRIEAGVTYALAFELEPILGAGVFGFEAEVHAIVNGAPRLAAAPARRDVRVLGEPTTGPLRMPYTVSPTTSV